MPIIINVSDVRVSAQFQEPVTKSFADSSLAPVVAELQHASAFVQQLVLTGLQAHRHIDFPELEAFVQSAFADYGNVDAELDEIIASNWSEWMAGGTDVTFAGLDVLVHMDLPDLEINTLTQHDLDFNDDIIDETVYERAERYLNARYPELAIDDYDFSFETIKPDTLSEVEADYEKYRLDPTFDKLKELVTTYDVSLPTGELITDVIMAGTAIVAELDDDEPRIIKLTDKLSVND